MCPPDQEKAAAEMARVCTPGGKIGLATWAPSSSIGELFKLMGPYLPPPAGVKPPSLWGTEERLRELFGNRLDSMAIGRKDFVFRYRSAAHWLEGFRTFYGPMQKAFRALDSARQESLATDPLALAQRLNRATDGSMAAPGQYLEVVIKRK